MATISSILKRVSRAVCSDFFKMVGLSLSGHRVCSDVILELLLHSPFHENGHFFWLVGCVLFCEIVEASRIIQVLKGLERNVT